MIVGGYDGGTMSFEQAFALAQFDYDFQDTNAIIAGAEAMAGDDPAGLRMMALSLKAETAILLNNIGLLDSIDFRGIANWLRNRNTIEYLGIWEQLYNPNFKPTEFEGFRRQAGLNAFTLSPKKWKAATPIENC